MERQVPNKMTAPTRKELVGLMKKAGEDKFNVERLCHRGRVAWMLASPKGDAECYLIFCKTYQENDCWHSEFFLEEEFDDPSCPANFLDLTRHSSFNRDWRVKAMRYWAAAETGKEATRVSKKLFEEQPGKTLKLILDSKKIPEAIVESAYPLVARHRGLLYRIPPRKILSYEIIDQEQ